MEDIFLIGEALKKINFIPKSLEAEVLVDKPVPARKETPEWFKKIKAFENNNFKIDEHGDANVTAKMCQPLSDSFSIGYIQKTWCDINIENINGEIYYSSSMQYSPISHRENISEIPIDEIYYPIEFTWKVQWIPKLPNGYSVLYTHPINRSDLPFQTVSGVVDADKFFHEGKGLNPFYVKKGFSGIIPKGTPFLQIIPFKRENWKSSFEKFDIINEIRPKMLKSKFYGVYKNNFWTKKTFL